MITILSDGAFRGEKASRLKAATDGPRGKPKIRQLLPGPLRAICLPFCLTAPVCHSRMKALPKISIQACSSQNLGQVTSSSWINLSSHNDETIKAAIEASGVTLMFLPAYSPDLNPIELMFSKLKTLLCKTAERPVDALWNSANSSIASYRKNAPILRHAGCNQTGPENELDELKSRSPTNGLNRMNDLGRPKSVRVS
jgi:transposase